MTHDRTAGPQPLLKQQMQPVRTAQWGQQVTLSVCSPWEGKLCHSSCARCNPGLWGRAVSPLSFNGPNKTTTLQCADAGAVETAGFAHSGGSRMPAVLWCKAASLYYLRLGVPLCTLQQNEEKISFTPKNALHRGILQFGLQLKVNCILIHLPGKASMTKNPQQSSRWQIVSSPHWFAVGILFNDVVLLTPLKHSFDVIASPQNYLVRKQTGYCSSQWIIYNPPHHLLPSKLLAVLSAWSICSHHWVNPSWALLTPWNNFNSFSSSSTFLFCLLVIPTDLLR